MATLESAIRKYDRKVNQAAWSAGVANAAGRYGEGVARFIGVRPTRWEANWQAGVSDPGAAAAYAQNTSGSRWAEGYRRAAQLAAGG